MNKEIREYAYPLNVIERRVNSDTGSHRSTAWHNFLVYTETKHNRELNNSETFSRELEEWNACSDMGCNTISFKTEADRTLFLLRFS
jgi:hypothetical protein